ncbi:hypothetical protein D9758_015207 [Tetrapyrgos nigripes]|uniref:Uncharacterized protein n=1 Tax=Tetrapyrgos nigripes TaxID=182062 RepID=A0A8H5CKU3_9AGAR|nr:hypothetical protein D9758_015207 [Tetrapyrgos nigripes]
MAYSTPHFSSYPTSDFSSSSSSNSQFSSPTESPLSSPSSGGSSSARSPSLAWKLRHFDYLFDALAELGDFFSLSDPDFTRSGTEIVMLFEIAQGTLEKAGIILRTYTHCPAHFVPYKRAYFSLLKLLRNRDRCIVDRDLRKRWLRLTFRLKQDFVIDFAPSPRHGLYLPALKRDANASNLSPGASNIPPDFYKSMPPPDAFPPSQKVSSLSCLRLLKRAKPLAFDLNPDSTIWDTLGISPDHDDDDMDTVIDAHSSGSNYNIVGRSKLVLSSPYPPRLRRPMTGRFGIFCTAKTSMHQTSGISRSVGPGTRGSGSGGNVAGECSMSRGRTLARRPGLVKGISAGY